MSKTYELELKLQWRFNIINFDEAMTERAKYNKNEL